MNPKDSARLADLETHQILINASLAKIEDEFKFWRAASRKNVLEMITEQGVSVARAALLSGHHRATITVWLQVHNAEKKQDDTP